MHSIEDLSKEECTMLHWHILEVVNSSKYLEVIGWVTIKDDLSWETHVQNTVGKANRTRAS